MGRFCKDGNEPSGTIESEEFYDCLSTYFLLKNFAPWSLLDVQMWMTFDEI